jgi:UDP-N-acetyl-2-amino-2-deoxyglucuronate dehydrogenase
MDRVKTAVIGTGKVSHNHAKSLQALPESVLTAVCGRTPEKTAAFAAQYGIKPYTDVAEMLTAEGIEAVVVCTPHPAHAQPAIAAMQAGSHVLVEKPLASTLTDCDAMITAARACGVKLGVVSQRRFYEPVKRLKAALDAGKIGRPILGTITMLGWRGRSYYESDPWRGTWEQEGGGVLVNQAPHQLDLLLWFMGSIDELFGYWGNLNHEYIEVEDTALATIRFKNGGMGSIVVSNSQNPGLYGKTHVHGSNGATIGVQTEGGSMFIAGVSDIAEPPVNDLWTVPGEEALLPQWQEADRAAFEQMDATQYYFDLQNQDFLQAILADRPPLISGEDGRAVVELFTGIYEAQKTGRPVKFPL